MLGALSTPVVAVPLLVMGLLPWWVAFVPVGCLAVAVAFARATARVERTVPSDPGPSQPVHIPAGASLDPCARGEPGRD